MEKLTNCDVRGLASLLAGIIKGLVAGTKCYPIPRGGVPAAYAVQACLPTMVIVEDPEQADFFLDDIVDTGKTLQKWCDRFPGKPFFALIDKTDITSPFQQKWVIFPWEGTSEAGITDHITRLIQYVGEDATRQGLLETPVRVAKAWKEWTSGYKVDPAKVLKTFQDGAEAYDQIILVRDIPFYSHCEHHLAPFFGVAHVGYIPDGRIVGLSKIPELVRIFSQRLQVQERLTAQVADAMFDHLAPKGVGVIMEARHLCMESRGKRVAGQSTTTSAMRGVFAEDPSCKAEFIQLTRK